MAIVVPHSPSIAGLAVGRVCCAARGRERLLHVGRQARAVAGSDVALDVAGDPFAPTGPQELLALDAPEALGPRGLRRLREARGPVLVVRARPVLAGPVLAIDDGSERSLPALCVALMLASATRAAVVLVGGDGARQRAGTLEIFLRHGIAAESVAVRGPEIDGIGRVIRARGAGLAIVAADEASVAPLRREGLPARAPCSVLVVR